MRSALLNTFCVALCAAAASATTLAQAPSEPASTKAPLAIAALQADSSSEATLLAETNAVPAFSSSAGEVYAAPATTDSTLPEAPTVIAAEGEGQAGVAHGVSNQPVAKKYAGTILPGQSAVPLSAGDKVVFAIRDTISPYAFLSRVVSASYSQAVDSQPHYGQGWGPFGQRLGAAYARGTVQDLATEAVFDSIFRDDPRYYMLGRQHKFLNRVVYAATRVVITRTDSGHNTLNAPLLLGYAAAAGANFAYYPHRDRNFSDAASGYGGSLGGGVLGFEVSEFLPDALRLVHLHHD